MSEENQNVTTKSARKALYDSTGSRLTSKQVERFARMMRLQERFQKMDNRELCWHFIEFVNSLNLNITGMADQLCETVVERLYPEYDGDEVTRQSYGWLTPEGRVEYLFSNTEVSHGVRNERN